MAQELELKLLCKESLDEELLITILVGHGAVLHGSIKESVLKNAYFDTDSLILHNHRIALRVRNDGDAYIQTLKTAGTSENGLHSRGEWEWRLENNSINVSLLEAVDGVSKGICWSNIDLVCVFSTDFRRRSLQFSLSGFRFELVHDVGSIFVPDRDDRELIDELEVEYIGSCDDGNSTDDTGNIGVQTVDSRGKEVVKMAMLELSEILSRELQLVASDQSKAQRGYALFKSQTQERH